MNRSRLSLARHHLPLAALAVYGFLCLFFWAGDHWWPEWDSATYILAGQSLAAGEGYSYLEKPFFLRPPGLSWLISLLVPEGIESPRRLNLMVMSFAVLAGSSVYLALKERCGRMTAAAVALLTGTSPFFVNNFNWVVADFPAMAFLYLGAAFFFKAGSSSTAPRQWLLALSAGLSLACSFYFRSVALLLLPGLVLSGWKAAGGPRRHLAWLPAVVMVALCLPWMVYAGKAAQSAQVPSEQLLLLDYKTALLHEDPGDPSSPLATPREIFSRVKRNSRSIAVDLLQRTAGFHLPGAWVPLMILVLAGFGVNCLRRPSILEWLAAAYTLLLLIYFDYHPRLLLPLLPLVYLYLFDSLASLFLLLPERFGFRDPQKVLLPVFFLALFCMNAVEFRTFSSDKSRIEDPYRRDQLTIGDWLGSSTPPDAKILAYNAPALSLLSGRRVYTYRFPRTDLLATYSPDFVVFHTPFASSGNMNDPYWRLQYAVFRRSLRRWNLRSDIPGAGIVVFGLDKP